jgi:DNA-binding transcriptional regulator YdaS (Cro superfamily)
MSTQTTSAIERAADLVGVPAIAKACDVSVQAVYKWIKKGYPPAERCPAVEKAVRGEITRFELLPPSFTKPLRRSKSKA